MAKNTPAYIEYRLEQWAYWYCDEQDQGFGYPKKSLLYRMQTEGNVIRKNSRDHYLPTNDDAEEMEDLIRLMAQGQKTLAEALQQYYLGKEKTVGLKARAIGMSETQFKEHVHRAIAWLLGALTMRDKK